MGLNYWVLYVSYFILGFLILYPVIRKRSPEVFDFLYFWKQDYNAISGSKRKFLKFTVKRIEPFISKTATSRFERLVRIAGYPFGLTGKELIVIYLLIVIGGVYISTQVNNSKLEVLILGIGLPLYHIMLLMKKKRIRQLYAAESIRFLKRRFVYLLRQNVDIVEALNLISEIDAGEFGVTLRRYIKEAREGGRPLREVMFDLRSEYEIRSLDEFCIAIEWSDLKSPSILAEAIYRQIISENARMDEFIENKKEATKAKMIVLVAITAVWTLALTIIFAVVGFFDFFRGGGDFLFF